MPRDILKGSAAHFALCSDSIVYCDFDTPLMFVGDPVSGGIQYDTSGVVSVPEEPGLGASFEEAYLAELEACQYNPTTKSWFTEANKQLITGVEVEQGCSEYASFPFLKNGFPVAMVADQRGYQVLTKLSHLHFHLHFKIIHAGIIT